MSSSDRADQEEDEAEVPQSEEESLKITQLKSALWLPIGQLVDSTTLSLSKNATPHFIGALTELVWHQIASAAVDVEAFARHAGRTTVTADDVLLLARRNDALKCLLEEELAARRREADGATRGTATAATRGKGKAKG